ncbi:hypothetical protein C8J55DRAFT_494484 [Lentinula edodes]|uniref:Uncharacterized protein n=1 Tax=Lentinula lateritia TaxID=40482 RepID=A0A9W8ZP72_9AGAR|nr:hypothetical protein C8J55DRAFT_494484 [Lentinula edodes]
MSINNSMCKSRVKVQEAVKIYFGSSQIQKSKVVCSIQKYKVYSRLFYKSECKEKVDAAIAAFGPAITKGDRMVIRNKHINAGYQAAQLDPIKIATIESILSKKIQKETRTQHCLM